jgi:site-specific DNA-methyltransferase (adenine-specific)
MLDINKVYNGDSDLILKNIDSESIDLVVTSPPYDNLRKYNGVGDTWNHDKFKEIANKLCRTLKKGGVIVWNVNDKTENGSKTGTSFRQALYFMDLGLNLNDTMLWKKKNCMPQVKQPRYTQCFEYMFIFSKGKPKTFNPIMRPCKSAGLHYQSTAKIMGGESGRKSLDYHVNSEMVDYNVWEMAVAQNRETYPVNGKEIKHPAVFPYELPYRHIQSWSNEGDIVLDPFAGSGTTLLAARDLKRKYIGIEMNSDYCEIIKQRLDKDECR